MPDSFDYTTGTNSENVRLLQALIDDAPEYTEETNSRNANILKSIINNTEYTDAPQSEIEELLLRLKAKIGGEIEVDELNVTENGTYDAGVNKAYNPVKVELPLNGKTITENGTYTASDDNLAGYDEVTVNVPTPPDSYQLKSLPTGAISTIEDGSNLPMPSLKVGIEAVQSGSGDPSPTNIRPISGWSAVNMYDTGINIWDEEWEGGAISNLNGGNYALAERIRSKNYISVKPNTSYYLYLPNTYSSARIACYDKDKTYLGQAIGWLLVNNNTAFTTPSNTFYIRFVVVKTDETYNNDISINYPSTDTEYHAYNGQTYTIDLDGTRYGCTLDITSGELVVDRAYVDMGTINWVYSENAQVFGSNQFVPYVLTNGKLQSSQYKWNSTPNVSPMNLAEGEMSASPYFNRQTVMVKDTRYTDATAFKTAMNGVQLVYELATPQTIPQDNLAIATQEGTNNLWADSGDVLEGSYFKSLN